MCVDVKQTQPVTQFKSKQKKTTLTVKYDKYLNSAGFQIFVVRPEEKNGEHRIVWITALTLISIYHCLS